MSYLITTEKLENFDFIHNEFYITSNSEFDVIYKNENEFILIEGFVYDLILNIKLKPHEIIQLIYDYRKNKSVFPEHITGQYNIIFIQGNYIDIITDFIGMKSLCYHFGDDIYISNNIYCLKQFGFEIDSTGLFQSMISGLYIPLNSRSLFKNVNLLRSGEYLQYDIFKKAVQLSIDSIDMKNLRIEDETVDEFIEVLKRNAAIYDDLFENIILPISGGVDSRVTLSSFKTINSKFKLVSYGESDYIDNRIAKKIAESIGAAHQNVSFQNHLFPTSKEFDNLIERGGDFFVGSWFSVLNALKEGGYNKNSVVLIGDVLDTLRAKNVKFLRGRLDRVKYQLKRNIGIAIKLPYLDIAKYSKNQKQVYRTKIEELYALHTGVLNDLSFNKEIFIKETEKDIDLFLDYVVQKFNPKNQANLEEAFFICTWGARTMAKQINVFKGEFQNYVLMASRHVVKHNLNYSVLDRFEDKLTHRMLRKKGYDCYSRFPTSQIPFVAYRTNINLKYMLWAFRSSFDQVSIKLGKGRLVKHIEWAKYYKNPKNKVLLENLLSNVNVELKQMPLSIFNKRANGDLWPLSEVDINMYSYLLKIKKLK